MNKPITNGDYIRSLSDEEIILRLDICPRTLDFVGMCLDEDCDVCQAEWLKCRTREVKKMKRYKLAAILLVVAMLAATLTGCKRVSTVEEEKEDDTSMFVQVEKTGIWKNVYNKQTKVMYAVSLGYSNYGNFTLLVNADGSPMLYDG
jgi:hypothetical protein